MSEKLKRGAVALAVCAYLGTAADAAVPTQQATNQRAQVLADFKSRIDRYVELHNRLKKQVPPLKETKNPADIQASQDALAAKIREARKGAQAGEIFTPEIKALLRQLMYPEVKGTSGAETKKAIKDDSPKSIALKVNASYPESAPLPTVPPNLLAALPKLPEELEYRIVNRDLILRDVHANIIVDFVPGAVQ